MHPSRLWILFGALGACAASGAVVYKWTDEAGVVHFSDQAVPGAEKIVTSSGSSIGQRSAGHSNVSASTAAKPAAGPAYKVMAIESPAADQVFFNDEIVAVRLHLEPALQPDHAIKWMLNGKPLDDPSPTATTFQLQSLARGAYSISAVVTDAESGASQSADAVTFYVRQPSELAPLNKQR